MKKKNSFELILKNNLDGVGNTPMFQLQITELKNINLIAKLELVTFGHSGQANFLNQQSASIIYEYN
jgi:hypothetical protein